MRDPAAEKLETIGLRAENATDTLDIAPAGSGCNSAKVSHKPRLLNNRSSYFSGDLPHTSKARA